VLFLFGFSLCDSHIEGGSHARPNAAPTGILTTEIINWTGKLYVAPRSRLADLAGRGELRRTGIYLLVGPDPDRLLLLPTANL
jgi:hypothetical protein